MIYGSSASHPHSNTELKQDSHDSKANNFVDRGRRNREFNRERASSYSKNSGKDNEGERRGYNREDSHTTDTKNFLVRGRGTAVFNRGEGS